MKTTAPFFRSLRTLALAGFLGLAAASASAHAFLQRAAPAVGGTVKQAPTELRLLFTEGLEKASSLKVFNSVGKEVDRKNAHPDPKEPRLLIVSLPPSLGPGTYKVVWRAVATDTHITQGDFTFRVEP